MKTLLAVVAAVGAFCFLIPEPAEAGRVSWSINVGHGYDSGYHHGYHPGYHRAYHPGYHRGYHPGYHRGYHHYQPAYCPPPPPRHCY